MIENFNIDKSEWVSVKFGDLIREPKETAKNIFSEGIECVVGLEHIDSESIHLRRFGSVAESTTFTKKFSAGDVLFGRRRAYLKKAAQANFSGICSGDITVMRVKDDRLLPELLPFIVQNEKFFDYAIEHSAGGLSPRVKFKDLANYEFLLPPKGQQLKLAQLLWSMDSVIQNDEALLLKMDDLKKSLNKKFFDNYKNSKVRIGDLVSKVGSGVTPKGGSKVYQKEGVRFIRSQNVLAGEFNFDDIAYIPSEVDEKMSSSRVQKNDVLLNITGASIGRCCTYTSDDKANVNQHVCIIRTKCEELDPCYLEEFLNSYYGQHQIQILQAGGNREGLNFGNIKMMKLPAHPIDVQRAIINKYKEVKVSKNNIRNKVNESKSLQRSLINQVF